ncbi:MAG: diphosphomevalonate decarboxylase [Saprospiraceae bacterium]|nr:diphosphomevalonate decarboxylase [Saprospiraceae bacterium]
MAKINSSVAWKSPSNIAIVKYWGKKETQIPMNPSLSFTLQNCCTETKIEYSEGDGKIQFLYDGKERPDFLPKIEKFFELIQLPFLKELDLRIHSKNNFPHSAGIASSASSMSALSLCITEIEQKHYNPSINFLQAASLRSRLGSGSASRSVYNTASLWGKTLESEDSSDNYAIDWSKNIHSEFMDVQDWIFLVNQKEKSVSSTDGHDLMHNHPYKMQRIEQAINNISYVIKALKNGDWESFISVCEEEALSLHALMMSSRPGYLLLEPDSVRLVHSIQKFRNETKLPVCFTIDAGPNIHLLFPKKIEEQVNAWIQLVFPEYISGNNIIKDCMGKGPEKI